MDLNAILSTAAQVAGVATVAVKVAEQLPNKLVPVTPERPQAQMSLAAAVVVLATAYVALEQGRVAEVNLEEVIAAALVAMTAVGVLFSDLKSAALKVMGRQE